MSNNENMDVFSQTQPTENDPFEEFPNDDRNPGPDNEDKIYGSLAFVGAKDDYPFQGSYDLWKDETLLGKCRERNPNLDIGASSLDEYNKYRTLQSVSRLHCKIIRENQPNGSSYTVIEECSRNGTFVNREKMDCKRMLLPDGAVIGLGSDKPVFRYFELSRSIGTEALRAKYTFNAKEIGHGAFGQVYGGQEKRGARKRVAVKQVAKRKFSISGYNAQGQDQKTLQREINILLEVDHPSLLKIFDVDETKTHVFLVTEYCAGGEMFDNITHEKYDSKGVGERLTKYYFYQILSALKYLHSKNICHRDLKPENVLFVYEDRDYNLLKLSDFGMSKVVDDQSFLKTVVGTPAYMPPEILRNNLHPTLTFNYNLTCDIWSAGVIFFICLGGYPPFSEDWGDIPLNDQILKAYVEPRMKDNVSWREVSPVAKEFMMRMFVLDANQRMTAQQALNHPWFAEDQTGAVAEAEKIMAEHCSTPTTSQEKRDVRKRPPTSSSDSGSIMDVDDSPKNKRVTRR